MPQLPVEYVVQVLTSLLRLEGLHDRQVEALQEAIRRLRQHERLVAEVLPYLVTCNGTMPLEKGASSSTA
jgi:hypothetical protein